MLDISQSLSFELVRICVSSSSSLKNTLISQEIIIKRPVYSTLPPNLKLVANDFDEALM